MIRVRPANEGDELAVRYLLGQIGYGLTVEEARTRLALLKPYRTDPVLVVSEDNRAVGIIAMHRATMLHHTGPVVRITTRVVCIDVLGKGVCRILFNAAADLAGQAGRGALKLTNAIYRTEFQAFYKALGSAASTLCFYPVVNQKAA